MCAASRAARFTCFTRTKVQILSRSTHCEVPGVLDLAVYYIIYVCVYIYVYIFTHTHTHTHTIYICVVTGCWEWCKSHILRTTCVLILPYSICVLNVLYYVYVCARTTRYVGAEGNAREASARPIYVSSYY